LESENGKPEKKKKQTIKPQDISCRPRPRRIKRCTKKRKVQIGQTDTRSITKKAKPHRAYA